MTPADLALGLTALAMLALRGGGLLVAGVLRADHPAIAWAAAVAQATLAAYVALAIATPERLAALAVGAAVLAVTGGRLLLGLAAGLVAATVLRA